MKILVICAWGRTVFELGGYCKNALSEIGHDSELFTYSDERISSRLAFLMNIERNPLRKILYKFFCHILKKEKR
jgi:hypothetical protein